MKNPPLPFNGYEQTVNFENARTQFSTPFDYLDIALDAAISNQVLQIAGDFLYVDTAFDGIATIELNNEHSAPKAPFRIMQGFALNAIFKQIKFSCPAQPGKKIRLMFSTGERVIPSLSGTLNVTGTVSTLESGISYGASYKTSSNMAANNPDTIFTPAANANGAIIQYASFFTNNATGYSASAYLAKNAAPVSNIDGDLILSTEGVMGFAANFSSFANTKKAILVPAGKGLYFIGNVTELSAHRSVIYTLL